MKNTLLRASMLASTVFSLTVNTIIAEKNYVSLEMMKQMSKELYEQMSLNKETSFVPDLIIGVARGGLMPLAFLAGETMFNNKNVRIISVGSYNEEGKQEELKLLFPITTEEIAFLSRFKSILVVDDLVDSGKSLSFVVDLLHQKFPEAVIKTAVLFYKKRSEFKPNYYVEETEDWIVFPSEV